MCLVVLQKCLGFVESATDCRSETCVTCDVDGTEEFSIDVEEAINIKEEVSIKFEAVYIKDEIPETTTCPPVMTEHEVSFGFWSVYCFKKES
jgi:hypothetical protein